MKTKRQTRTFVITIAVAFVGLLIMSAPASAQNYWSATGAQCNPDQPSESTGRYQRTSGSVKFYGNNTGVIGLFCSVSKNTGEVDPNRLRVTYQDTDLEGNSNTLVTARLFWV